MSCQRVVYFASKYLVEVSELSDLAPQVLHDLLVVSETLSGVLAPAFNDGGAEGQALEVVLVQVAIVVNVCGESRESGVTLRVPRAVAYSRGGGVKNSFSFSLFPKGKNKCLTLYKL